MRHAIPATRPQQLRLTYSEPKRLTYVQPDASPRLTPEVRWPASELQASLPNRPPAPIRIERSRFGEKNILEHVPPLHDRVFLELLAGVDHEPVSYPVSVANVYSTWTPEVEPQVKPFGVQPEMHQPN